MGQSNEEKSIIDRVKESGFKKIKLAITDIDGVLRGKYVHIDKFLSAIDNGFGFCNVVFGWDSADVCYENDIKYTGWHSGYPDAQAKIDLASYREIPWENGQPFFLADFVTANGDPLEICPRQILKKIIAKTKEAGYDTRFGLEFEWFNFEETPSSLEEKSFTNIKPITPGMFGYSILRSSQRNEYFKDIMDLMLKFDVPIEGLHTETGPGVYEVALINDNPLISGDRGVLFKTGLKEIAFKHGVLPSFMAKWNEALPGCSGHLHQSLGEITKNNNLFYNENDEFKMSELFKNYLAGQLSLLPEFLVFFAPTVNSYKRLTEGMWAPTTATWGVDNRTSALRVIPGSGKSTRLETRVGGADINPYLAIAAALASGLYGIQNKLQLTEKRVVGNAYQTIGATKLATNLKEATDLLNQSKIARSIFGDDFINHYVATRYWEWQQFQKSVTDWELKRYFEII